MRSQSNAVTALLSARIRDLVRNFALSAQPFAENRSRGYRGLSAGSDDTPFSFWVDASGEHLRNNSIDGYDAPSTVALVGVDYFLSDQWLVGFAAGYTHAQISLKSTPGSRTVNGAVAGPYVSYLFDRNYSVDLQFNYTSLANGISVPALGLTDTFHGNRLTGAVNGNAFFDLGDGTKLTAFAGYHYTWEGNHAAVVSAFAPRARNLRLGMVKTGVEVGRVFFDNLEVYLPLTFEYETTAIIDHSTRAALVVGIGARYQFTDTIRGGLLLTTTEIKQRTQDLLFGANLNIRF